jgi:hypothetical protein
MANFADDTNVEVLEKEAVQKPEDTPIQDEVVQEQPVEDDASEEETPAEEVQATRPEGTSPAMQELARQWLPEKFIEAARDDEALKGMIDAARETNAPKPEVEEPEFELSLPEDEVDESVRKQFQELNDHYKGQISTLKKDMGTLVEIAKDMQEKQQEQIQQMFQEEQRGFDLVLDDFGSDVVGKAEELSEPQRKIRSALYDIAQDLKSKKGGSLKDHALEAAKYIRVESKQQKQAYAKKVKDQSNGRLGSGNSPRLPEPGKTKEQLMEEYLEKIGARHGS